MSRLHYIFAFLISTVVYAIWTWALLVIVIIQFIKLVTGGTE